MSEKPKDQPRLKKFMFVMVGLFLSFLVSACICEGICRFLESRVTAQTSFSGEGGRWESDGGRWGWRPKQGKWEMTTDEFKVEGEINSLNMNDIPYVPGADDNKTRIFVVGSSHTYAAGTSMTQTWVRILENKLNAKFGENKFRAYNGAVTGFNMHQYLLRLTDQGPILRPHYVIIGLSYSSDLYTLLPPDRGGWIYGGDKPRDYFDFDDTGKLVQKHWEPPVVDPTGATETKRVKIASQQIRNFLDSFATFRYLRRSKLAFFIGSHIKVDGQTLWPNMEILFETEPNPKHEYQWRLFEAILQGIKKEADRQHAIQVILVGVPYLPQVYDEIWNTTFGTKSKFSRTAGINRVRTICEKNGVAYIDLLQDLQDESRKKGRWLHHQKDAHPTPEGHEVIAESVIKLNKIKPLN